MQNNIIYKKMISLASVLGAPEPMEIFQLGHQSPSNSQLQGRRVGEGHKNWRAMPDDMLSAYFDGLISWADGESEDDQN